MRHRPGLTLVEVASALAIALLAAGAVATLAWRQTDDARLQATVGALLSLRDAVELARLKSGAWPTSLEALRGDPLPDSVRLVSPWGTPYHLASGGTAAAVWVDVPLRLPVDGRLGPWIDITPTASRLTRLTVHVRPSGAPAPLLLERRRVAGDG